MMVVVVMTPLVAAGCGGDGDVDTLTINEPAVAMVDGDPTRAVVTFRVTSPDDDAVVAVTMATPLAGEPTIVVGAGDGSHDHDQGGLSGVISLPADRPVTLSDSGTHVMIERLAEPLAPGSEVTLTLELVEHDPVTVTAIVE
jgi:copper(I)-binding protein